MSQRAKESQLIASFSKHPTLLLMRTLRTSLDYLKERMKMEILLRKLIPRSNLNKRGRHQMMDPQTTAMTHLSELTLSPPAEKPSFSFAAPVKRALEVIKLERLRMIQKIPNFKPS